MSGVCVGRMAIALGADHGRAFDPADLSAGSSVVAGRYFRTTPGGSAYSAGAGRVAHDFDNAAVGIMFLRNRVIYRCNRKLAEILGYAVDNLIGQTTRIFYFDDTDFLNHLEQFLVVTDTGGVYVGELRASCHGAADLGARDGAPD